MVSSQFSLSIYRIHTRVKQKRRNRRCFSRMSPFAPSTNRSDICPLRRDVRPTILLPY